MGNSDMGNSDMGNSDMGNSDGNGNGNSNSNSNENSDGDGEPNSDENSDGDGVPNSNDPNSPSYGRKGKGSSGRRSGSSSSGRSGSSSSGRRSGSSSSGRRSGSSSSSFGKRISSVSPSLIENEIVPGIPIDITPDQYDGPQKSGIYKVPFEKDAKTGFLQTMFMTYSPQGYKYYKIYGTDVGSLESDIKNFINFVKSTDSPSAKFKNTIDDSIKDLKNEIEEQKAKYDTLEKQFNYLEPEQRTMASRTLALVQSRISNLIESLDDALRIKEIT